MPTHARKLRTEAAEASAIANGKSSGPRELSAPRIMAVRFGHAGTVGRVQGRVRICDCPTRARHGVLDRHEVENLLQGTNQARHKVQVRSDPNKARQMALPAPRWPVDGPQDRCGTRAYRRGPAPTVGAGRVVVIDANCGSYHAWRVTAACGLPVSATRARRFEEQLPSAQA